MSDDPELDALRKKRSEALEKELGSRDEKKEWPSTPIAVTDQNFKDVIARYPFIVIDFWADWCGPCKMMSPILDSLAREYQGKVVFGKLNVDENPQMSATFKVMSIPTMMIVKEREMVERITGAVSKPALERYIQIHL